MRKFICATCRKAGREVVVEAEDAPTMAEVHKAHQGYGLGFGNHGPEDMEYKPDTTTLAGFCDAYIAAEEVAADIDVSSMKEGTYKHIIVRSTHGTLILSVMELLDHLCVDAHPFQSGKKARVGAFGMEVGRQFTFPKDAVDGTSHGWPAAPMVALLLGKQADVERPQTRQTVDERNQS